MNQQLQRIEHHTQGGRYHLACRSRDEAQGGHMELMTFTAKAASPHTPQVAQEIYRSLAVGSEDLGRVFCFFGRSDRPLETRWGYLRMSNMRFQDCGPISEDPAQAASDMGISLLDFQQGLGRFITLAIGTWETWQAAGLEQEATAGRLPSA